ncbi:hypothetical protein [Pseudalkalibacillus sp. SCS-8]|uniref:hypothetical protein n=1 Tax=Pseudalkalibacillus nanhaiensis TaxID=3115291 RepID=UPI0032DB6C1E
MFETLFLLINGIVLYFLIHPTKDMLLSDDKPEHTAKQIEVASLYHDPKVLVGDDKLKNRNESPTPLSNK